MIDIFQLYTLEQVDDFIDYEICRNLPGLRAKAESSKWTATERATNPKLDAVLKALERRAELLEEVRSGIRGSDGHLNILV